MSSRHESGTMASSEYQHQMLLSSSLIGHRLASSSELPL